MSSLTLFVHLEMIEIGVEEMLLRVISLMFSVNLLMFSVVRMMGILDSW